MNRRVTVVFLCWNRWPLTQRSLDTFHRHTDLSGVDVIVVDNGSTDETPAQLRAYDWVKVVSLPKNLGYVRGNNAGIAAADPGSDILLLNNDVEFREDGWLDRLREAAHSAPDVGVVGCRLVLPDGRLLHTGTYILPETFWGQQIGSLELDVAQFHRTREVQGIVFACAYIRREVVDRIGPLSLDYESYFEDTDYCLRVKAAGFRTLCCGEVTIVHHEHGSTSDCPDLFDRIFRRSRATFEKRWKASLEARYAYPVHWQSVIGISHGYGMTSREMLRGLDERGVRMTYSYVYGKGTPVPFEEPANTDDYYLNVIKSRRTKMPPPVSVVYGQGDVFRKNVGKYRVGYTMLEVDGFPAEWVRQANEMDEVWVPTQANRDAFVRSGLKRPVYVMPLGVSIDRFHPGVPGRRNPRGEFVFLSSFEWGERKAPGLLLKVFNDTFRRQDPVVLVCKVNNRNGGLSIRREVETLRLRSGGGRIVFLFNKELPYAELPAFYGSGDCYISSSLGEGWDMPLMEAMACALPAIATDWGAHTEFIHPGVAYPLASRGTIPAVALCPYYKGFSWANPDPDHLSALLRHVVENRDEAAGIGRQAAAEVARRWSVEAMTSRLKDRLDDIAGGSGSGAREPRVRPAGPSRPCVAVDVSRGIGEQISGVGRYALNLIDGLARFGPDDLDYLALPGFGAFVHPEFGTRFTFDPSSGKNVSVYRGPLPAYGGRNGSVPDVRLVHSTGHMTPEGKTPPLVWTAHDLSFLTHPEFHTKENVELCTRNIRRAIDGGALFVAVSESTRRDLISILSIPEERIRVVPNTYDDRLFRPMPPEEAAETAFRLQLPASYFLFLGSLEPRKNLETLLDAVTRFDVGAPLVVAGGSGWLNDTLRRKLAGAGGRVEVRGYVPTDQLAGLIGCSMAVVYPSLYEGFGLPVLEAMACGKPVVTTRVSSLPEVAGDAAAYLDEPKDAAALAGILASLASDAGKRRDLSERALERARRFRPETVTRQIVEVYRERLGV